MKNYVQDGRVISILLAANVASGEARLTGSLFGVAQKAGVIGETVGFVTEGVFDLPYGVAAVVNAGDKIYWDDTAKTVTKTVGSNTKVGIAVAGALSSAATACVKLVPTI